MTYFLTVLTLMCLPVVAVAAALARVTLSLRGLQIPRVSDF